MSCSSVGGWPRYSHSRHHFPCSCCSPVLPSLNHNQCTSVPLQRLWIPFQALEDHRYLTSWKVHRNSFWSKLRTLRFLKLTKLQSLNAVEFSWKTKAVLGKIHIYMFGQDWPLPISPACVRNAAVSITSTHNHPSTPTSRFVPSTLSKPGLRYQGSMSVVLWGGDWRT